MKSILKMFKSPSNRINKCTLLYFVFYVLSDHQQDFNFQPDFNIKMIKPSV